MATARWASAARASASKIRPGARGRWISQSHRLAQEQAIGQQTEAGADHQGQEHRDPHPAAGRVRHLVLYATLARGIDLADEDFRQALVALVRSGWGAASQLLATTLLPEATANDIRWFARFQRRAATADNAAKCVTAELSGEAAEQHRASAIA